jgi:hypothetical protein
MLAAVTALLLMVARGDRGPCAVGNAGGAKNSAMQHQYQRRNQGGSRFSIHPHDDSPTSLMMTTHRPFEKSKFGV